RAGRTRGPARRPVAVENPRAGLRARARRTGPGVEARCAVCSRAALPVAPHRRRSGGASRRVVMAPSTPRGREPLNFAQQLERLEEIVRRLEGQELDLDQALQLFEEGVERLREARERLVEAEAQGKQVLADQAGNLKVEDFDA